MGWPRGTPVGRRRPLRDPQHHHLLRPVHRRRHQRRVRQGRPDQGARAVRSGGGRRRSCSRWTAALSASAGGAADISTPSACTSRRRARRGCTTG
nr:unnamed protein product [Digitaria exilis]